MDVYIEDTLIERLVNDAKKEPGFLPFVQETLFLLWKHLERRYLPLKAYEKISYGPNNSLKGLKAAIAIHADDTIDLEQDDLHESQLVIIKRIFLRLIHFGEGRPDTRRQQLLADLYNDEDDLELFNKTIVHLTSEKYRLLTLTGTEKEGKKVDIAHEVLITSWPQLQEWIEKWRDAEITKRQLEAKIRNYGDLKHEGGFLDQVELQQAQKWLESEEAKVLNFPPKLIELIEVSSKRIKEQIKALRTRFVFAVTFAGISVLIAIVAIFLGIIAEK